MKKLYFLLAFCCCWAPAFAQDCSDIFISEYIEGSGSNKAIEIYNPTGQAINLAGYTLNRYRNGQTSGPDKLNLVGSIPPYGTWVIVNGQTTDEILPGGGTSPKCDPALQALANQLDAAYPAPCYFNGDDAMTIEKVNGTVSTRIDILGKIGEDPGVAWTSIFPYNGPGAWITSRHTMVRKASVRKGVTTNPTAFNPLGEYDTLPGQDNWTNLGRHTCDCAPTGLSEALSNLPAVAYPNPAYTGQMHIAAPVALRSLSFISVLGQVVLSQELDGTTNDVAVPHTLPAGVYMVQVMGVDGRNTLLRVVVQ